MTLQRRSLLVLLVAFLLSGLSVWAETNPKSVVEKYCRLDYDGARIGIYPGLAKLISPLAVWRVEPGWDLAVVISSYTVGEAVYEGNRAIVIVEFSVIGRAEGNSPVILEAKQEKAEFHLVQNGPDWIVEAINGRLLSPHVSVSALIINLELILNQPVGESRRKILLNDVERLRKIP